MSMNEARIGSVTDSPEELAPTQEDKSLVDALNLDQARECLNHLTPQQVAMLVAERLGCKTDLTNSFLLTCFESAQLFDKKQSDYGPHNISTFGVHGVLVRSSDKFERLKNLYGDGQKRRKPKNESILDNWRDIGNYGLIAVMCELGRWPKR